MLSDVFDDGHAPIKLRVRKRNQTADGTITQPAGTVIDRIFIRNDTANAVTGGIKIGTTAGGVDVLAAGAVGASAVVAYAPVGSLYSATARTLYVEDVSAWNSAQIDVCVEFTRIDKAVVL